MELIVTEEHIRAAMAAGACEVPPEGTPADELTTEQLLWFAERCPEHATRIEESVGAPLWTLAGPGYGYGYGYGDGDGDGDGDGSGYGYGYGYGSGSGYGDGDGDGSGYGDGSSRQLEEMGL